MSLPQPTLSTETWLVKPRPRLRLLGVRSSLHLMTSAALAADEGMVPTARLSFDYTPQFDAEGATMARAAVEAAATQSLPLQRVPLSDSIASFRFELGDRWVVIPRDREVEKQAQQQLRSLGWLPLNATRMGHRWAGANALHDMTFSLYRDVAPGSLRRNDLAAQTFAFDFLHGRVDELRALGWHVEVDASFPFRLAHGSEWSVAIHEDGERMDWFGLELGVEVDGEAVSLVAPLLQWLAQVRQGEKDSGKVESQVRDAIEALPDDGLLYTLMPDGRGLPLSCARLKPVLRVLHAMWRSGNVNAAGAVRLSLTQAAELAEMRSAMAAAELRWLGGERLQRLADRIRGLDGVMEVAVPQELRGELRPYQQQGLAWLQFLREYELGGILADDMGLGKTVQTLAHLLLEKAGGRLDRPSLILAPTSVVPNWAAEAARFAPALSVLSWQGKERSLDVERLPKVDVVLSSYALLPRDREILLAQDYHLVILDEAQAIKNPRAQISLVVQQLKARHRLCLTGTPMENHLEELWSLCHFLIPGLLGDVRSFRTLFRTPIEKHGDLDQQLLLQRRIRPFVLRRLKDEVLTQLPPKTEVIERVELHGGQRDLYESIRLSMHAKVRAAVRQQGVSRSHIVVLDALLKLRQVCCDPRLLPETTLGGARIHPPPSAKLARLEEMLETLLDSGRRVLLFSQFTSMLSLIESSLKQRGWRYLKLTGASTHRGSLVERFQAGEAPLFLVSLKAGGTGLNLTAADTVIHYDPWWNPAVEQQATDRAHRIGQDKPVFVHKLVTRGTVEEKIVELQARKAALAAGLFAQRSGDSTLKLQESDIEALFAPLGAE